MGAEKREMTREELLDALFAANKRAAHLEADTEALCLVVDAAVAWRNAPRTQYRVVAKPVEDKELFSIIEHFLASQAEREEAEDE